MFFVISIACVGRYIRVQYNNIIMMVIEKMCLQREQIKPSTIIL